MFYDWNIWNAHAFFTPTVPNGEPNTFYIDKNTGKISLTEFLDFETIQQYIIVVKVTDSSGNFVSKNKSYAPRKYFVIGVFDSIFFFTIEDFFYSV